MNSKLKKIIDDYLLTDEYKEFKKFCDKHYTEICGIEEITDYAENNLAIPYCGILDSGCNRLVFKYGDPNFDDWIVKFEYMDMGGNFDERELIRYLKDNSLDYLLENLNLPVYHNGPFQVYPVLSPLDSGEYDKQILMELKMDFDAEGICIDDLDNRPDNFGVTKDGKIVISDYEQWEILKYEVDKGKLNNFTKR